MSISVQISPNRPKLIDAPAICGKYGFLFGARNEYDFFEPDRIGSELVIADKPYGRGVNLRLYLLNTEVYLPTPCTTSDLNVFMTLIREVAAESNCKKVSCFGKTCPIRYLSRIEKLAKIDMREAIKHLSQIDPLENSSYIMTPFACIDIDEKEQAQFKNSQSKFDQYITKKQSSRGINYQAFPDMIYTESGISSVVFVDAGRYLIVPKTITRIGTNQILEDAVAINGEHEMNYAEFIDKVPNFKEQFDAKRFIIKFAKKDFLQYAKKCSYVPQPKQSIPAKEKKNSETILAKHGLKKKDITLLDQYFNAMANLYGIISLQDAFDIIGSQTSHRFTKKQFLEFARRKNSEFPSYTIATLNPFKTIIDFDNDIVNNELLFVNESPYKYIKRGQEGKEYYIPPKSELLKYQRKGYLDDPTLLKPLITFLDKHAIIYNGFFEPDMIIDSYLPKIKKSITTLPVELLLQCITDIEGCSEEAFLQRLVKLIQDLHNNTRLWINCGYTPAELREKNGFFLENVRLF